MSTDKTILRALRGETLPVPPVWLMRQAGRYLPEYKKTRAHAGSFLDLCYNPELAAEVTLQPIRRFGFDAAILFADILLIPQALGADLWFVTGEGPRLSKIENAADFARLKPALPAETTLIGFAGAPWTVATYMIAGQGTPDQAPAKRLAYEQPEVFFALLDRITEATIAYLSKQIEAGAEVVKLFDSWAGALPGPLFERCTIEPTQKIVAALRKLHGDIPIIGFPRGAGMGYARFADAVDVQGLAIDTGVNLADAARLQSKVCVQGNLDPLLMVTGGQPLIDAAKTIRDGLSAGPHIFNLGHGITPQADPANVDVLLKAIRG